MSNHWGKGQLKQMAVSGNQAVIQNIAKCAEAGDMDAIMVMCDICVSKSHLYGKYYY